MLFNSFIFIYQVARVGNTANSQSIIFFNLDFKKHACRGANNELKKLLAQRKIQRELKRALGVHVDMPRDGGHGTSNDGSVLNIGKYKNILILNPKFNIPRKIIF